MRACLAALVAVATMAAACGSRPGIWNEGVAGVTPIGMTNGMALVDAAERQVHVFTADANHHLTRQSFGVGHGAPVTATSPDGSTLFVLVPGEPRTTSGEGAPTLTAIKAVPSATGNTTQVTATSYPMSVACGSLAIDPMGHWAIAYDEKGFVSNPNELVLFDLTKPPSDQNPIKRTLQSLGSTPQRFTFTPPLLVDPRIDASAGQRRLLIIETQSDFTVLDLDHAFDPSPPGEITVPLTTGTTAQQITPAHVAVDAFDATSAADARFALRAVNSSDVFTFTFAPPDATSDSGGNDFKIVLNETDVGGAPSDMAFVHTADGSVQLAVLVPSRAAAVLVQPDTSITSTVDLPGAYANLSLVTGSVSTGAAADVALLWNGKGSSGVALWTVGQQYFNVSVPGVTAAIQTVLDVPGGSPLKVLAPQDANQFFVLNLGSRLVAPLDTSSHATLLLDPSGSRVWAFAQGGTDLASIALPSLKAASATTDQTIDAVYPIGCGTGCEALVALHESGAYGVSVFDANDLSTAPWRESALLVEAP